MKDYQTELQDMADDIAGQLDEAARDGIDELVAYIDTKALEIDEDDATILLTYGGPTVWYDPIEWAVYVTANGGYEATAYVDGDTADAIDEATAIIRGDVAA